MSRFDNPVPQFFGNDGTVGDGWKLEFKESGTSTDKDTFADVNLTIKNTNPVICPAGRVPNCFFDGTAKIRLLDENDVLIWERDPVGGDTAEQFGDYDSVTSYSVSDIVRGSDNEYYISIINNNAGFDPTTTAAAWSKIVLIVEWNTNETYAEDDTVRGSDGKLYRSLADANTGNDPVSTPASWTTSIEDGDTLSIGLTTDITGDVTGSINGNPALDATTSQPGFAEFATAAEDLAGASAVLASTPAGQAAINPIIQHSVTTLTTGGTSTVIIPADDTIPQITEGDEFTSVTFTPKLSTSTVVFRIDTTMQSASSILLTLALFVDGAADAVAVTGSGSGNSSQTTVLSFSFSPGSTDEITFMVRFGSSTATAANIGTNSTFYGAACTSTIEIKEIR